METSMETRIVSLAEIKQHNTADDCWIAVHSKVWDITHFINQHPGGPDVLLNLAGSDATDIYNDVHAPDIIEDLPSDKLIGFLESSSSSLPKESKIVDRLSIHIPYSIWNDSCMDYGFLLVW
ncbi:unnamed protein product, partial [Fusarium langsethiae]